MKPEESIFVKCACGGCSLLEINYDEWYDDKEKQFYIALWADRNSSLPMPKKERIRWCDHVMKTGKPWADHTIVTQNDAQRIVNFLTKHLAKNGKTKKVGK
jgi:hypothetical protein